MVYIDNMNAPFRRMIMCHMIADTTAELLQMADSIGLPRKWIQYPNTYHEHFDICLSMKAKALALGAKEITWREFGAIVNSRIHPTSVSSVKHSFTPPYNPSS